MRGDRGRQGFRRLVVKRAIQVAEHAQRVLTRRFRNKSSNLSLIPHEHDLFLVALEIVKNGTEVAGDVGYGQRLHNDQSYLIESDSATQTVPTIVPATRQNCASKDNAGQCGRSGTC